MLAWALTAFILLGYAASLWWLLRRESPQALLGVVALCAVALCVRLVDTTDYPRGLNEDEPKILWCAGDFLRGGNLFAEGCTMMPVLLNALFQAQLVPLIGPNRWAIRSYSTATSVLSVALAFAVARALGLRVAASLAAGALVALLPWSIFYGRISIGGELTFHQLLLLAALVRLMWDAGDWAEVGMGSLGLTLLLYDYFCGRAMLLMPLVAAGLARGRRRRWQCVLVLAIALLAWVPHLRTHPDNIVGGLVRDRFDQRLLVSPVAEAYTRTVRTLKVLVAPTAMDSWLTVRSAALHPPLVLGLAGLGVLLGVRRGLFLVAGFLLGLAPSVLSNSEYPSTHRIQMAFAFVALAAACPLDLFPWRWLRGLATATVVLVAGVQSIALYFSPRFWGEFSRDAFDWERTEVVEALPLPPHPPLVVMRHLGYYWDPRAKFDRSFKYLSVDNWFPPNTPSIYGFSWSARALQPFYLSLFGPQRVQGIGRAFVVRFEAGDWSYLQQHGWMYEMRCGQRMRRGQVPTLFHPGISFDQFPCWQTAEHTWTGHWRGPAARMRLAFSGHAVVETPAGRLVDQTGTEARADFALPVDTDVTISLTTQLPIWAGLYEVTPAGERLPDWTCVDPPPPAGPPKPEQTTDRQMTDGQITDPGT